MNEEDKQQYIMMGLAADVANKAQALQSMLNYLQRHFQMASGMYSTSRFNEPIEGTQAALAAFMEAMRKKEAYSSATYRPVDSEGTESPEERRPVSVPELQREADSARTR